MLNAVDNVVNAISGVLYKPYVVPLILMLAGIYFTVRLGFLQFRPTAFTSWFFEETCGFIREFWVAEACRGRGHGAALLRLAEEHFKAQGIFTSILTTRTAERFYLREGYQRAPGCRAKNGDPVYVKRLA